MTKRNAIRYAKEVTMKKQKNYDKKVKNTRILLSDYLVLKRLSQAASSSMAETLHRLILHQTQLPLLDLEIRPTPAAQVTGMPAPALRVAPVTTIATNGNKAAAFRIKPKEVKYD